MVINVLCLSHNHTMWKSLILQESQEFLVWNQHGQTAVSHDTLSKPGIIWMFSCFRLVRKWIYIFFTYYFLHTFIKVIYKLNEWHWSERDCQVLNKMNKTFFIVIELKSNYSLSLIVVICDIKVFINTCKPYLHNKMPDTK